MIQIYTDGAASGNPGPGGYGVILRSGEHYKELSGGFRLTTNNRMELLGAIFSLEYLREISNVILYTDSKYVQLGITEWIDKWIKNNWKTSANKDVVNKDLWERLLVQKQKHNIKFQWIKGHANNELNNEVDKIARNLLLRP